MGRIHSIFKVCYIMWLFVSIVHQNSSCSSMNVAAEWVCCACICATSGWCLFFFVGEELRAGCTNMSNYYIFQWKERSNNLCCFRSRMWILSLLKMHLRCYNTHWHWYVSHFSIWAIGTYFMYPHIKCI